ncbi:hypothetical protein PAMA_005721 [Pampus argenteus]
MPVHMSAESAGTAKRSQGNAVITAWPTQLWSKLKLLCTILSSLQYVTLATGCSVQGYTLFTTKKHPADFQVCQSSLTYVPETRENHFVAAISPIVVYPPALDCRLFFQLGVHVIAETPRLFKVRLLFKENICDTFTMLQTRDLIWGLLFIGCAALRAFYQNQSRILVFISMCLNSRCGLDASTIQTLAIIGFGTQTLLCADESMWDFRFDHQSVHILKCRQPDGLSPDDPARGVEGSASETVLSKGSGSETCNVLGSPLDDALLNLYDDDRPRIHYNRLLILTHIQTKSQPNALRSFHCDTALSQTLGIWKEKATIGLGPCQCRRVTSMETFIKHNSDFEIGSACFVSGLFTCSLMLSALHHEKFKESCIGTTVNRSETLSCTGKQRFQELFMSCQSFADWQETVYWPAGKEESKAVIKSVYEVEVISELEGLRTSGDAQSSALPIARGMWANTNTQCSVNRKQQ